MRQSGSECGLINQLMIVFHGGQWCERLMRLVMVVLMRIAFKFPVERADIEVAAVKRIKLVATGGMGALDAAVQLGRSGWQHIQRNVQLLAGGFELGPELAAAIDLDRLDLERRLLLEVVQKVRGAKCVAQSAVAQSAVALE